MLSHHSWGVAVDLNIAGNYYGVPPDQDSRLVAVMERWGFAWGGGSSSPTATTSSTTALQRRRLPSDALSEPACHGGGGS